MDSANRTIEITGSDVEDAINKGLRDLGLTRADVIIEVLDEGSPGFLGIGGRDARLKIVPLSKAVQDKTQEGVHGLLTGKAEEVLPTTDDVNKAALEKTQLDEDIIGEEEVALEVVERLLIKMQISAMANLRQTEPDDLTGESRWVVEIEGDDLGLLIGSRGDTLNAFQYVARLITGHITHKRPNFLVDVEGYRQKREQALARLAERMAGKVLKRGRPVTLEPMPPNERRIIHITLRQNEQVYTESTGERQRRRVRIFPTVFDE